MAYQASTFHKHSVVEGRDSHGAYDNTTRRGHILTATALEIARRHGWLTANLIYVTTDMNGRRQGETRFALDVDSGAATELRADLLERWESDLQACLAEIWSKYVDVATTD